MVYSLFGISLANGTNLDEQNKLFGLAKLETRLLFTFEEKFCPLINKKIISFDYFFGHSKIG